MPRNGLYLADGTFLRFADAGGGASLSTEIATRSRSIDFYSIGNMYLPNPDPVLKKQGKDIEVYTDLLTDDRVGGSMINRINATLALNWEIDHGKSTKSRQAKFIKEIFGALPLNRIIEQTIRNTRGFGYGPAETVWVKRGDGLNAPVDVIYKPQRWFVFSQQNELRFLSREHLLTGEELPARRFLCPTNEASYDNPYGLGNLSRCFWPVVFKRGGGWRFRMKYAEKFGAVWPVGKLPRSATQDQIDDLLGILEDMINDGVAVIPDDGSVVFLESASKGATSDMFHSILADADSAISTIWLGHAGAGQSTSGSLGGEEMAIEVRQDLRDSDKTLVEETLNQLIDWICEENWGNADNAPRFSLWEEEDVDKDQAERDVNLTSAMEKSGLKLSRAYYLRTYNLEEGDVEEAAPKPEAPGVTATAAAAAEFAGHRSHASHPSHVSQTTCPHCFGETAPDAVDAIAGQALAEADGSDMVARIRKHIEDSRDLPAARNSLADLRNRLDIKPAADALAKAAILANLTGRAEVMDGVQFAEGAPLPFDEAIAFYRQKLNVTSEHWTDLWQGEHSRQFTVAGVMRDDLLADFQAAIDAAISEGTTHAAFLKEFDAIVARYGWSYNGSRGWRSRTIYETNIRTAYQAGRYQQMTDPDVLAYRPNWMYRHGDSVRPRPLHLSWHGTVLPADDPWWESHYTPNGWGCKCSVVALSDRDLARENLKVAAKAPDDGTYEWVNKRTGEVHDVPRGIDPGWAYNPGKEWLNPATGKTEKYEG